MKILRLLLTGLALTIALAAFLLIVAVSPVAQTWFGQWALARQPGIHGTFGGLKVRWSHLDVTDLRIERDGAVLTAPAMRIDFSLWTALRERRIQARSLVARGWTLDLNGASATAQPRTGRPDRGAATPAANVPASPSPSPETNAFRGLLAGWNLPGDGALDSLEIEGNVIAALPPGAVPTHLHVVVTGGGLGAGREAKLAFELSALDLRLPGGKAVARGRAAVRMDAARSIDRVELESELFDRRHATPDNPLWSLNLVVARDASGELYRAEVSRGARFPAKLSARWTAADQRLSGTWQIDGRDSDAVPFASDFPLPTFAVAGEGTFATDPVAARVHVTGHLEASASRWPALTPSLAGLGAANLAARFDLTRSGHSIRCDQLDLALSAAQPVVAVRSLQPFEVDERSGEIKVADPQADWLAVTLQALPLAWLAGLTNEVSFPAGELAGSLFVNPAADGFAIRSATPLVATGVAVARGGRTLAEELDLSLVLNAGYGTAGGQATLAPLTIDRGGQRLATIEVKATRPPGAAQTTTFSGKWEADPAALAAQLRSAGPRARSVSGDFSGTISSYLDLLSHALVVGHDPTHTLAATIRADLYTDGTIAIVAPLKIAFGPDVSELRIDLDWRAGAPPNRAELNLTGQNVALAHLRLLAAPVATLGGIPAGRAGGGAPDKNPFWGDWRGNVTVGFERLRTDEEEFVDVGGRLKFETGSIRLDGGHGGLPGHNLARVAGALTFDAAAEFPYRLQATAAFSDFDATPLFAPEKPSAKPMLEGRFSVAGTITGKGVNLADLVARTQEVYHFTSKGGILRLLRADVAQALPPPPESTVGNALDSVGSALGHLFGVKPDSIISADVKVSPTTQAVLDFRDAVLEIGYENLAFAATRGADRSIQLTEIALTAPEEQLTGTGQIAHAKGVALFARPLSLELKFGARGHPAKLLAKAGLIQAQKDPASFVLLPTPVHFGGSLGHIDATAWRDLLVKAARPTTPAVKKPAR